MNYPNQFCLISMNSFQEATGDEQINPLNITDFDKGHVLKSILHASPRQLSVVGWNSIKWSSNHRGYVPKHHQRPRIDIEEQLITKGNIDPWKWPAGLHKNHRVEKQQKHHLPSMSMTLGSSHQFFKVFTCRSMRLSQPQGPVLPPWLPGRVRQGVVCNQETQVIYRTCVSFKIRNDGYGHLRGFTS